MSGRKVRSFATLVVAFVAVGLGSGAGSCGEVGENPPRAVPWQREGTNPILVPGFEVGAGRKTLAAADSSILYDEEEKKWKAWFNVAFDQAGRTRAAVAYAESTDGIAWTPMTTGLALEPGAGEQDWDFTSANSTAEVPPGWGTS